VNLLFQPQTVQLPVLFAGLCRRFQAAQREKNSRYYRNNKPKWKAKRIKHRSSWLKCRSNWLQRNPNYYRDYFRNRKLADPSFKIRCTVASALANSIVGKIKKPGRAPEIIGCSIDELKAHLERQFQPGMSWSNYGRIKGVKCWEIDHIRPIDSFDLTQQNQLTECWHYSNLQPLWAVDNQKKGNREYGKIVVV